MLQFIFNLAYSVSAFKKSKAETANSTDYTANTSTPFKLRAFFVRSTRTPKERQTLACSSMVACSGKGSALCCVPCIAVLQPVARYRPITLQSDVIAQMSFYTELIPMIFKFLLLGEKRLTVRIRATSEAEARQRLNLSQNAICIARLNTTGAIYA